jgi:hypothetical protein
MRQPEALRCNPGATGDGRRRAGALRLTLTARCSTGIAAHLDVGAAKRPQPRSFVQGFSCDGQSEPRQKPSAGTKPSIAPQISWRRRDPAALIGTWLARQEFTVLIAPPIEPK